MIKLDSAGNLLWAKRTIDAGYSGMMSLRLIELSDHGFCVPGQITRNTGDFLMRTDSVGNLLWANAYGGPGEENGYDLKEIAGGIIAVGYSTSAGQGGWDVLAVKTDLNGNLLDANGDSYYQDAGSDCV